MKKLTVFFYVLVCGAVLSSAQSIDLSEYQPTTLEDYVYLHDTGEAEGNKYCFPVNYIGYASSGDTMYFYDTLNASGKKLFKERITRIYINEVRPPLVTVYVTCEGQYSTNIDDIVIGVPLQPYRKPWLPFVSNGKSGLHGWYLHDLGNGTYREVYFE
ncbi:MAG: hypothetical protein FWF55_05415 [Treponema sp.]|nr:hypothetical protein [Treponema sp.]